VYIGGAAIENVSPKTDNSYSPICDRINQIIGAILDLPPEIGKQLKMPNLRFYALLLAFTFRVDFVVSCRTASGMMKNPGTADSCTS
jgi:hypothetical protein